MVFLCIVIVIALLITMVLPIAAGFWLNKRKGVSWRVMMYGALAYFISQALITLIFSGFASLVENGTFALSEQAYTVWQVVLSVVLGAVIGVSARWLGMKYLNEDLNTLGAAYGLGFGYGGIESLLLVGFPLLTTFITMLSNINIDPATTTLDPEVVVQLEELWKVQPSIPLAGSVERISAFIMHVTVTILILQVFKRKQPFWIAAAMGIELVVNGIVAFLSAAGLGYGWISLVSIIMTAGNVYLLYRLDAFKLERVQGENPEEPQAISPGEDSNSE